MPYSTGCSTALSNFEAGQNYKDVSGGWVGGWVHTLVERECGGCPPACILALLPLLAV
jgi:hypothetical protein